MATAIAVDGIWTMNGWFLLLYSQENYSGEDQTGDRKGLYGIWFVIRDLLTGTV